MDEHNSSGCEWDEQRRSLAWIARRDDGDGVTLHDEAALPSGVDDEDCASKTCGMGRECVVCRISKMCRLRCVLVVVWRFRCESRRCLEVLKVDAWPRS